MLDNVTIGTTTERIVTICARLEVEAWDGDRKIGDGTHRRGIVNVNEFEKRFVVKQPALV